MEMAEKTNEEIRKDMNWNAVQEWTDDVRDDARENGIEIRGVDYHTDAIQGILKSTGTWSALSVIGDGNATDNIKDIARDYLSAVKTQDHAYKLLCSLMEQNGNTPTETIVQAKIDWIDARECLEDVYLQDILSAYLVQMKEDI